MKNILKFEYGIDIDSIKSESEGIYSFYIDYDKFLIMVTRRNPKEIFEINKILREHINQYHQMVLNLRGELCTKYQEINIVVFRIVSYLNAEIGLKDILDEQIIVQNKNMILSRNNWDTLWERKIDYLEYQYNELGKEHKIIRDSFYYYIGLAENAIQYFSTLDTSKEILVLSHKKIEFPNLSKNFYNSEQLIIDYRIRDIAEYIKEAFFNSFDISDEIDFILNNYTFSLVEYNLLFARLLFPSYYLRELELVIEKRESEEQLLKYVSKITEYEEYLKTIFEKISQKSKLIPVDWIVNK